MFHPLFTITSLLNSSVIMEAGMYCTLALQQEFRKHSENDTKYAQLSWKCIPLAVESYGAWGREALKAFSQVATRLAFCGNTYKSKALADLYLRLSHTLITANDLFLLPPCAAGG